MKFRRSLSAVAASLLLASGSVVLADGGDWTGRFWGLGWGDGYHAPPRQGWLHPGLAYHQHGEHGQGRHAFDGQPYNAYASELMPGGYPYRSYEEPVAAGQLPEWLWDPSEPETVVETIDLAQPQPERKPDLAAPAATRRSGADDRSLGLPPALDPTERTDPRAMRRRGNVQTSSNGWPR